MNNSSAYTGWSNRSNISYGDYLQGKEFERSIRYGISDQTKSIIASNEQLAREQYKVLEDVNEGISSGFTTLSFDISALQSSVDSGFNRISSILDWGFSEVIVSLGRVNDSLDALIRIAKTPAQTWAYEQFEIARDEFRRGLYSESLESVLRSINGYGSNPGYKTEYRFHYLLGTIRLGSYKNSNPAVIDLPDAEAAFLRAARYSSSDLPLESARSLLCAGRAAFTQKNVDKALKYSTDAIALDPNLAEAYFQSAQSYCVLRRPQDAKANLVVAIGINHDYAVKAASDGDICQYSEMLQEALRSAKDKYKVAYERENKLYANAFSKVKEIVIDKYAVETLCTEQIANANRYQSEYTKEASRDNVFGYVHASRLARDGKHVIESVVTSFRTVASQLVNSEESSLQQNIGNMSAELSNTKPKDYEPIDMIVGIAILVSLPILIFRIKNIGEYLAGVVGAVIVLGILSGGAAILVLIPPAKLVNLIRTLVWMSKEGKVESEKKVLQHKVNEVQAIKAKIFAVVMPELKG